MSIKFTKSRMVLKNTANKAKIILGVKINPGQTRELFGSIVGLTEDRVIAAMQKPNGEIYRARVSGSIEVLDTSLATFENDPGTTLWPATVITSDAIASSHTVYLCDASSGPLTLTLPIASSLPGRMIQVKKIDNSLNQIIIKCQGSDTVDGGPDIKINDQNFSLTILSGNNKYYII